MEIVVRNTMYVCMYVCCILMDANRKVEDGQGDAQASEVTLCHVATDHRPQNSILESLCWVSDTAW